jgi:hypothetical protein
MSSVLARPGTPTSRQCPRASRHDHALDDGVLAHDHLAHLPAEPGVGVVEGVDGGWLGGVYGWHEEVVSARRRWW